MLDIGGGQAGYSLLYQTMVDEVVVVDVNDFSDSYAESNVSFYVGDATTELPFESATFDLIVSHSTFEHLTDVPATMREMDRLLKVGAHAFVTIRPLYYSAQGFHRREFADWQHLLTREEPTPAEWRGWHLNGLTLAQMLSYVGQVGWRIRDFTPLFHPVQSPPAVLRETHALVDLMALEFFALFEKIRDLQ